MVFFVSSFIINFLLYKFSFGRIARYLHISEMESNRKEAKPSKDSTGEPEVEGFVVEGKGGNPLTHDDDDDDDDDPNADPYRQCFKRVKKSQPNKVRKRIISASETFFDLPG